MLEKRLTKQTFLDSITQKGLLPLKSATIQQFENLSITESELVQALEIYTRSLSPNSFRKIHFKRPTQDIIILTTQIAKQGYMTTFASRTKEITKYIAQGGCITPHMIEATIKNYNLKFH